MITLLTYDPSFGEAAASPFCVKAIMLLNMAGVEWQRENMMDPRKMPYQKLPAIKVGTDLIADSDNIRAHLEAQGADFDAGLSATDKAHSRALIRMAEEHIYFCQVMDRWGNEDVWPVIRDAYFTAIPKPIRGFITGRMRSNLMKGMNAQGLGRFTEAERVARVDPDLKAISTLVGDGYLFGDKPTAADASVGPMLAGILATPVPTLLQNRVKADPVLPAYADRIRAHCHDYRATSAFA